jgi:nitrate reductase gamma subunit
MPFWKSILGFGWPTLPSEVITVVGAITIAVLIALLVRRLSHPVLRVISTADDYISVIVTILPLLTGLISYANIGFDKETNLALHLLSIVLVLVWFPFGKLMHLFLAFPTRYKAGADYGRKGVAA